MIAHIEAQGSLLRLTLKGQKSGQKSKGGGRGVIRAFSRASRRRLMRFMARLKVRKIRATFITLTFHRMVSHAEAKRAFKQFSQRIRRAFPMASVVWRLEYQPKRGAIHFHLLCFKLPFWPQKELQKSWEECTGECLSLADVRLVHGARSVMAYVSKYIAKVDDQPTTSLDDGSYQHEGREPACSRFWGYINKELLPLGQKLTGVLTDGSTIRRLSSFMWHLCGAENEWNSISAHLFADNAMWLCERAIEEGGCLYDEWEYTTNDHITHPTKYGVYEFELEIVSHSGTSFGQSRDHARVSVANSSHPSISSWVRKSFHGTLQSRLNPFSHKHGILTTKYTY